MFRFQILTNPGWRNVDAVCESHVNRVLCTKLYVVWEPSQLTWITVCVYRHQSYFVWLS